MRSVCGVYVSLWDSKKWRLNLELCTVVLPVAASLIDSKADKCGIHDYLVLSCTFSVLLSLGF